MLIALLIFALLERLVVFFVERPVRNLAWLAAVVPAKLKNHERLKSEPKIKTVDGERRDAQGPTI